MKIMEKRMIIFRETTTIKMIIIIIVIKLNIFKIDEQQK
jgi:hypothetical protein